MAEPQEISALLDQAIDAWNKKNPSQKISLSTSAITRLAQDDPELLTPDMQRVMERVEKAWDEAQRSESFAGKVTDFLNSPAGLTLMAGAAFIPGGGLVGGLARGGAAALKGASGFAKAGLGIRALLGGSKVLGTAGRAGAVGGLATAVGRGTRKVAPTIAKRAALGGAIGGGAETARQVISGEFPQPRAIGAAAATGAVAGQVPVGGSLTRALAAGVGGPLAGSIAAGLASDQTGPGVTGPAVPPPEGGLPEDQLITDLIATGNEQAIMSQYQQWLTTNPTAAQALIRGWAEARKTPTGPTGPAGLEIPRPSAITLKDESGAPVLGPDGKPIQLVFSEQTGQYDPVPVRITEQDAAGNQIERTIDPLTGKESRRFLTRQPIRQQIGGREVFVDPETGNVISATDRPPAEQAAGGRRFLIDPDTGEVVERLSDIEEEQKRAEEEQRRKRFETAVPLLSQLTSLFAQPSSRLRFLAQEGQRTGATAVPEFSILDVLGSILGGGDASQAAGALGMGGGAFQVSPRLSEILGLPAGSPLPIGGLQLSQLPRPQALSGLTPDERSELDAILDIATGGTRLSDVERKQAELAPPGGFGASARFVR